VQGDCRDFSSRTGVAAELVVLGDLPRLDEARSGALLRVAREALLNVEKHAHAHSVLVSLYPHEDGLVLSVADDGTGGTGDVRGLGRSGISEAVERVGGRVSFAGNEEGGSTVRAWVPAATGRPPAGP
jgi:LuxR family transcriptional regulator, regulator of acetate metabolism